MEDSAPPPAGSKPTLLIKGSLVAPNGDIAITQSLSSWTPIDYIIEWFRTRLREVGVESRVLVLKSETASGKSTVIPPAVFAWTRAENLPGIIVTQPRVITTIENVNEILKFNKLTLGRDIGWSTKYDKYRPVRLGILSATVQTLTQQLWNMTDEEICARYSIIMIDETHERDAMTDITLYMLKNFIMRNTSNPNCPFLVLMSATFDETVFLKYFGVDRMTNFIWCKGSCSPIEEKWDWIERPITDYIATAISLVEKICRADKEEYSDILIFMPGGGESKELMKGLTRLNSELTSAAAVFSPLSIDSVAVNKQTWDYRAVMHIPLDQQVQHIGGKDWIPTRRVIAATAVAETGLTLNDLKYVIDPGYSRETEFNPVYGVSGLLTKPVQKPRAIQRRGRVGRGRPGVFYPMYSADIYAALPSDQFAKTITDDPLEFIMMLIREQLRSGNDNTFNPEQLNLIDSPGPEALTRAYSVLWKIGFLDKQLRPTDLFKAAPISVRPESARMILAAYMWEVHIGDIITIAAYIQTMSKASRKIDFARVYAAAMTGRWASLGNFYRMRLTIGDGFIDGIMIYAALCKAIAGGERAIGTWAESMGIPFDDLRSFVLTRDSIMSEMIELEYHITDDHPSIVDSENFADTAARIKHCIYDGYRCNLMIYNGTAYHQPVTGLEIEKPKMFKDTKETRDDAVKYGFMIGATPKYVIYSGLRLKGPSSNGMFVVEPEFTSMLDGFVSPDLTYT